jgi:redox-sensitive bicupin YhaK (pirin superfamily)
VDSTLFPDTEMAAAPEPAAYRRIAEVIPTPWHRFRSESGAWLLHPADLSAFDPFVMVDHFVMPDAAFAPHPHAGFSAVTYLFEDSAGGVRNRDSFGTVNDILPGSLHWTQAGSGMLHEELPRTPGSAAHGLQLFVNSARANKKARPAAFHVASGDVPVIHGAGGARVRVVLGDFDGASSRIGAHTPITLVDITLPAHAAIEVPLPATHTAVVLVVRGRLEGVHAVSPLALLLDRTAGMVSLRAAAEGAQLVLLAGEPLREPIVARGPFVGNSTEDVLDMIRRYQSGAMGSLQPTPGAFD